MIKALFAEEQFKFTVSDSVDDVLTKIAETCESTPYVSGTHPMDKGKLLYGKVMPEKRQFEIALMSIHTKYYRLTARTTFPPVKGEIKGKVIEQDGQTVVSCHLPQSLTEKILTFFAPVFASVLPLISIAFYPNNIWLLMFAVILLVATAWQTNHDFRRVEKTLKHILNGG